MAFRRNAAELRTTQIGLAQFGLLTTQVTDKLFPCLAVLTIPVITGTTILLLIQIRYTNRSVYKSYQKRELS